MEAIIAIAALALCIMLRFWVGVVIVLVILFATSTPAHAHTDMHKEQQEQITVLAERLAIVMIANCILDVKYHTNPKPTNQEALELCVERNELQPVLELIKEVKQ